MLTNELKVNQFLLQYCRMLTADIGDERMAEQPMPGVNHPAWILGHLALTAESIAGRLGSEMGNEKFLPAGWAELFKPGTSPRAVRDDYPSKDELLQAMEQSYQRARDNVAAASAETLALPSWSPRMKEMLPTLREAVAFAFTGHVGIHLGQLSAWRRMTGLPPLF